MKRVKRFIKDYLMLLIVVAGLLFTSVFTVSYLLIEQSTTTITQLNDQNIYIIPSTTKVGIVFGGGIDEKNPTPLVQERLDTAHKLLERDIVDRLILSGDNRFESYNEPSVMLNYLVEEHGVDPAVLQEDFAGRSTYETCERANKVFGLDEAVLVSQGTHLPRAVYLCEHFGITSYGVEAVGPASEKNANSQVVREVLARTKAVFNAYVIGEKTILGDPIEL